MKLSIWLRLMLIAALALFVLPGCDDDHHHHDDPAADAADDAVDDAADDAADEPADEPGVVLVRDRMDDLRAGSPEFVRELTNPGTGTVIAQMTWSGSQPVRAAFRDAATRDVLADLTSAESPFELSVDTREGRNYFFYLGNPDGPDTVDVSYRLTFFAP